MPILLFIRRIYGNFRKSVVILLCIIHAVVFAISDLSYDTLTIVIDLLIFLDIATYLKLQ